MNESTEPVVESGAPPAHEPVMLAEVLELLHCRPGGTYVDATLGLGGHALAILPRIQPGGLLVGIDRDRESIEKARERLRPFADSVRLVHDNFKNLPLVLNNLMLPRIDGVLVDLGVSSYQLLSRERGFSVGSDAPLDMRMDRTQRQTAADLVQSLPEGELADLIYRYGEERHSRRIARAIVRERGRKPITRCAELAEVVRAAAPRQKGRIHAATRTFQALRIAVNRELEGLEEFLLDAAAFLRAGARLVVVAFHSLEDRIVKQAFRKLSGRCVCGRPRDLCDCPRRTLVRVLTPRPKTPSESEIDANPRARSARLRAVEKIGSEEP